MWLELTESVGVFVRQSSRWTQSTVGRCPSGTDRVHRDVFLRYACHERGKLERCLLFVSTNHSCGGQDVPF